MVNIRTPATKVNVRIATGIIFALACVGLATPSLAQSICIPRDEAIGTLDGKYNESSRLTAVTSVGTLVEFWANADTGTWTLFITRPDGMMCVQAAGEGFALTPPKPKGQGS